MEGVNVVFVLGRSFWERMAWLLNSRALGGFFGRDGVVWLKGCAAAQGGVGREVKGGCRVGVGDFH